MRLIDTVYKSIHEYPSLFYHKDHPTMTDFEISRMSVMEHLFSTLGNGYCWVDGYLCDIEEAKGTDYTSDGWIAKGPAYGTLEYKERYWPPKRKKGYKFAYEYIQSWTKIGFFQQTISNKWPFSIYGYQYIKVPDFIQEDWKQGLLEFLQFTLEYYKSDESLDGNMELLPVETRLKAIPYIESLITKITKPD